MSTRKEELKVNENITVNEPKFNEKIQLNLISDKRMILFKPNT